MRWTYMLVNFAVPEGDPRIAVLDYFSDEQLLWMRTLTTRRRWT